MSVRGKKLPIQNMKNPRSYCEVRKEDLKKRNDKSVPPDGTLLHNKKTKRGDTTTKHHGSSRHDDREGAAAAAAGGVVVKPLPIPIAKRRRQESRKQFIDFLMKEK